MKMDWLSVILLACIVCGRATSEDNEFTSTMMTTITEGTTKDSTLTEGEPRDTTTTEVTTKEATTTEGITKETTAETTTTEGTTKETTTTEGTTKETTTETTTTEGITEETQGTTKKATKEITTVEGATKTTTTEGTTKETTTTEGYASDTTTTMVTITEMETIATTGEITTGDITKEILTGVPMTTESNPVEVSNADTLTEGTTIKLSIPVTPTSSGLGFSTDSPSQTASDLVIPLAFSVDNITFHKENDEWNNPTDTVEQNASQSSTIVASDLLDDNLKSVTIPSTESFEATTLADLVAPISLSSNDIRETQSGTSISGNANLENIEISISYSQEHDNSLPDTLLYSTKDLDSLSVDPAVANEIFSASTPNVPLQSETTVAIPEDLTMESMSNLMAHSTQVQSDSTKIVTKNLTLDELDSVAISTSIPSNAGVDGIAIPSIVSSDESTSTMFSNSLDNVDSPMLEAMKPSTEIPLVSMQQDVSMLDTSVPSVPTIPVASTVIPVASTAIPVASTAIPVASTAIPVASTAIPVASTDIPVASKDIPVDLTSYSNSPTDSVQSTSFSSSMVGSTETTSLKSSTSFPMEDNLNTVHPVDSIVGNNEILIDQSLDTISTTEDTFETAFISTTESLRDSSNVALMNLETELAESSSQFNSKLSESTPTADPTGSPILKIKSHLEVAHENIAKFLHSHTSPLLNKLEESQNFDIRRDKKSTDFTNNQQSNYQEHFDFYRSVSDSLTSLEKRLG